MFLKYCSFSFLFVFLLPDVIFSQEKPAEPVENEISPYQIFEYRCVGPTRGGRVTAVAGVPGESNVFYMGATGGGIWKTEDYGIEWSNISDGYFQTPSIGAIRVAPSNPKIVFTGTGSDGLRSNVIAGKGVYKSADSGKSWTHCGLENTGHIGAVEIHPSNPDIVFIAAIGQAFQPNVDRGVFRTKDGGKSWEKVLFIADTVGVSDIEICPDNPKIIYAGAWRSERKPWTIISGGKNGGIYKSEDGGDTWKKLNSGLPDSIIGKIDLAVTPAAPGRLYALIEAPVGQGGLYISHNRGKDFKLVSTEEDLLDRPFYYCNVDADPNNADVVYVNSTRYFKSTDAGKTWNRIRTPHGDNHDMWINPDNSDIYIQANDGGANVTTNGGKSWSSQLNQPTAELYQVEVDDQYPYWLYAGQQDNSTIALPSIPPYNPIGGVTSFWMAVGGCETGPAVPKPGNHNIVYSNCKGRFGVFNKKTGQGKQYYVGATNIYSHNPKDLKFRFQRVAPIHVSPHNPDVVYHTSQYVHKTTDEGETWEIISPDLTAFTPETQVISGSPITRDITGEEYYSTIYAIRESPVERGVIWVGANDGPVHVTRDGGKTWVRVTPEGLPPGGRVDCVEPSPHQASKAYIAVLRYQLGDWKPYIYKTENFGESWTLLTTGKNGIPADYPTRVVREDPDRAGLLYAGTEFGLFLSNNEGQTWIKFQQNLPVTPITDIKVFRKDLVISTMGRSFWIMDDLSPLHQEFDANIQLEVHLFKPRDIFPGRYRGQSNSETNDVPSYPGPSANIYYSLSEDVEGVIQLDILNENNEPIRSYYNNVSKKDSTESQEPDMATGFSIEGENSSLNPGKGVHKFRWDLRHEGPWDKNERRAGRNGPLVIPGTYKVRIQLDGKSLMEEIDVRMNPKLEETDIQLKDLEAQETLCLQIRDVLSSAKRLAAEVNEMLDTTRAKIKENPEKESFKELEENLLSIKNQLETAEGRYMKNMLVSQLNYLYSMLNRADQVPGQDAYDRFEELHEGFIVLRDEMNEIKESKYVNILGED